MEYNEATPNERTKSNELRWTRFMPRMENPLRIVYIWTHTHAVPFYVRCNCKTEFFFSSFLSDICIVGFFFSFFAHIFSSLRLFFSHLCNDCILLQMDIDLMRLDAVRFNLRKFLVNHSRKCVSIAIVIEWLGTGMPTWWIFTPF